MKGIITEIHERDAFYWARDYLVGRVFEYTEVPIERPSGFIAARCPESLAMPFPGGEAHCFYAIKVRPLTEREEILHRRFEL